MSIVQAFKEGKVLGLEETGAFPQHIQTFISDVFLFPSTVYKVYKHDNESFNTDFTNLSDPETRRVFYEQDFRWNHYFNPSVYQQLLGVRMHDGRLSLTPETEGCSELVIKMRRIDAAANLTRSLLRHELSTDDAASLGYQLTKAIDAFPWRGPQPMPILKQLDIMMRDVEVWAWLADPVFPRALTDAVMHRLRSYIRDHEQDFLTLSDGEFVIGMDNHSDNVFYENGALSLIDIYPPKADWRFIERTYSVCRLSADIEILAGRGTADAFIDGCLRYPKMRDDWRPERRWFYQLYSALIKAPYLFFLLEKNPDRAREAELYRAFIEASVR